MRLIVCGAPLARAYVGGMEDNNTLWIALWHHRHGVDALPFLVPQGQTLTEEEVIEMLGDEFEADREEYIEVSKVEERQLVRVSKKENVGGCAPITSAL